MIVIEYSIVVVSARNKEEAICQRGPHKLWLKRVTIRLLSYFRRLNHREMDHPEMDHRGNDANTGRVGRTLTPVSAGTGVVFSGAIKSPTQMDFV
uniref:Uncharacterized protein n=1 Tax=Vespula pensylvanica TaxID=30213 RepID=A0A834U9P1_VESPE|nr:hypothetical protein H0235_007522 [Vespula pensylvanica]